MNGPILGWDVGGANIKAARLRKGSRADAEIVERPFALWREPQRLASVLREVMDDLGNAQTMGITMTAELADCFATKREGVAFVLDSFRTAFPDARHWVFGTDGQFRSLDDARNRPADVAAANWVASATLIARTFPDALFLDVGSTTSDIIPIIHGRVAACGRTDTARLRSGELVYTGALRTPVAAIVRWVPLGGSRCRVAAEHFAVAGDVHLWLGHIEPCDYTCETPDGRSRDRGNAAARLARMVCADREAIGDADLTAIADHVSRVQVRQIAAGIRQVVRRLPVDCRLSAVISGHGAFLARSAAEQSGLSTHDLAGDVGSAAARAVPAAAVARLLMDAADEGLLRR
jgi:(4-(4-[2-(gamma-L-glutamylamino)ethyl]phenoxymethyl)furan-2-yl)methanamine synthase